MSDTILAKHTPGPWEVISFEDLRGFAGMDELDPRALLVAGVTLPRTETKHGKADVICDLWTLDDASCQRRDEVVANARLIAAAPDLLAACHEVLHHADDESGFLVLVRAAIVKAEVK